MFLHEHLYETNIYIILVFKIIIFVLEHRHQGLHAKSFFLQVPLAPRFVLTHYGLQGITAKHGIMLFLTRPPKMTDSDYALALYVLLSRPRQLDDVHIPELPMHPCRRIQPLQETFHKKKTLICKKKTLICKKKDPYLQKKKTLICRKKRPLFLKLYKFNF